MAKGTHGLGRGLDALLPQDHPSENVVQEIDIGEIDPNREQPRKTFPEDSISQLAESIREQGVLQPILVTPQLGGRYRIVAGERRFRASRMAGLTTVPCIVRDMDAITQMEVALIENLQREDLNPIDAALGIRGLMEQCGYTQEAAATRLSKSRPAVTNLLRLLDLPEEVIAMIRSGELSLGHGRALAGLERPADQLRMARDAHVQGLSVRQLEAMVAQQKQEHKLPPPQVKKKKPLAPELVELESRIRQTFGVRAQLTGTDKKGKILLTYTSRAELERLNELINQLEE